MGSGFPGPHTSGGGRTQISGLPSLPPAASLCFTLQTELKGTRQVSSVFIFYQAWDTFGHLLEPML